MDKFPTSLVKSEDSLTSSKSSTSTLKNRRGCYKRRKTTQTWEKVSEIPTDDGYQWRKYGQKAILNDKYLRTYYRCTYKFDQRCQATKQVQRIQEDPPLYRTTYYDHHSCKSLLKDHEISHDLSSPPHTSIFISFNNAFPTLTKQECPLLSSYFPSPFVHKECNKEPTLDDYSSRHVMDVMSGVLYDSVELDDVFQPLLDFNDQLGMRYTSKKVLRRM